MSEHKSTLQCINVHVDTMMTTMIVMKDTVVMKMKPKTQNPKGMMISIEKDMMLTSIETSMVTMIMMMMKPYVKTATKMMVMSKQ